MGNHLRADLVKINQVASSMTAIGAEFANITHVADVGGAAGDPTLASTLSDFATGWSDIIGQLRELATMAHKAVQEYTSTDDTLARRLTDANHGRART